jgi:hypothetical protein
MSGLSTVVERVLSRLEGGHRSPTGATAKCPAHEDHRASLSISEGDDGRVLLKCHAGCEVETILSKLHLTMRDLFPPRAAKGARKKIVAAYDYVDANGVLQYQTVRYAPKDFRQRRPNGSGGWIWKKAMEGVTPVPYRLPELLTADPSQPVVIAEGEKDVDALMAAGFVATTNHGGADKWWPSLNQHFAGRHVLIIPDNDVAGREHVQKVGTSLLGVATTIRVLTLQNLPQKGDVTDWFARGGTPVELTQLIAAAEPFEPGSGANSDHGDAVPEPPPAESPKTEKTFSMAQRLIEIAERTSELFHDERGSGYAAVGTDSDVRRILPINGSAFGTYVAGMLYNERGYAATGEAVASARRILTHKATSGARHELHNRFAFFEGALWIDLADDRQQAVKVTPDGWSVVRPPILFRRFNHQMALPLPIECGDFEQLVPFVNPHTEADLLLLKVWTATAMLGHVPRPILDLYGPQGAAKSTTAKMIRCLTDPSAISTSYLSRRDEELALCLETNAVPLFDNVGEITSRQAELLCSGVTGAGFSKRELYTNSDEVLYSYRRAILVTGINVATVAPDLLDRFLLLQLDRIDRSQRRPEAALWQAFEAMAPTIFSGMLDSLSQAMRLYPLIAAKTVTLDRMADFCLWGAALAEPLGSSADTFLSAYGKNVSAQTEEILEADPIARAIREIVAARGAWSGTASDLLKLLKIMCGEEAKGDGWPKQANSLSRHLGTLQATLADVGIIVERRKVDHVRTIVLRAAGDPRQSSRPSPSSPVDPGDDSVDA